MDLNRINTELKKSMDSVPFSLELDIQAFEYHPEIIQQERIDLAKSNPVEKPNDILVYNKFIKSSQDNIDIRLRIYQHKNPNPDKTILYFHGGGYIFGLPEQVEMNMFELVQAVNGTIISVDYRLSPQYPFPVPILDGFDALQYLVYEGNKDLGINPDKIIVMGASAGGHLAASVAQMATDNNISHQILIYPVIHNKMHTNSMNEFVDSPLWNKPYAEIAWKHFLGTENQDKSMRYADLTNFDKFEQLPSASIIVCGLDPLRDEGIAYANILLDAKVKAELWVIPDAVHVFDLFESEITNDFFHFLVKTIHRN
ncbi:alpha/beta hydrolase [Empedobacter brevis]|uniref:alpha/beta hydrolase n=1 Tax=Empedobacter brevis TaxID=247 RepID=UPI00289B8C32|nr:alpha/beta hydrolase [Empedobacter brevis]